MHDGRADVEGRVREDFVGLVWERHGEEVLLDDADVVDMIFLEVSAEFHRGGVVWFDSPDFAAFFAESKSNHTGTSTNVEDEVALFYIAMTDEHES